MFSNYFFDLECPLHLTGSDGAEKVFSKVGGEIGMERAFDLSDLLHCTGNLNRLASFECFDNGLIFSQAHKKQECIWKELNKQNNVPMANLKDYKEVDDDNKNIASLKEGLKLAQDLCKSLNMEPTDLGHKTWWLSPWLENDGSWVDLIGKKISEEGLHVINKDNDAQCNLTIERSDEEEEQDEEIAWTPRDVQSQVLSELQGSPASNHVANPWSGRLHSEVSPASSINVSRKGKEKVDEGMRMPKVAAGHDDIDGHSSGGLNIVLMRNWSESMAVSRDIKVFNVKNSNETPLSVFRVKGESTYSIVQKEIIEDELFEKPFHFVLEDFVAINAKQEEKWLVENGPVYLKRNASDDSLNINTSKVPCNDFRSTLRSDHGSTINDEMVSSQNVILEKDMLVSNEDLHKWMRSVQGKRHEKMYHYKRGLSKIASKGEASKEDDASCICHALEVMDSFNKKENGVSFELVEGTLHGSKDKKLVHPPAETAGPAPRANQDLEPRARSEEGTPKKIAKPSEMEEID
ncbi:hypothetical protein L7F22_036012 [Adiantum nelumboides]|nr:hypothetical protein [Adiantum nelumboides]